MKYTFGLLNAGHVTSLLSGVGLAFHGWIWTRLIRVLCGNPHTKNQLDLFQRLATEPLPQSVVVVAEAVVAVAVAVAVVVVMILNELGQTLSGQINI